MARHNLVIGMIVLSVVLLATGGVVNGRLQIRFWNRYRRNKYVTPDECDEYLRASRIGAILLGSGASLAPPLLYDHDLMSPLALICASLVAFVLVAGMVMYASWTNARDFSRHRDE